MTRPRSFPAAVWLAGAAAFCLALACAEEAGEPDRSRTADTARTDQPDTVRPAPTDTAAIVEETHRHLTPVELDVDSIAGAYRNHYGAEFVDRHPLEGQEIVLEIDPEVVEAAERRTAIQWGYVELDAWNHLLGDLSESQRIELERRIEEFHRGMGGSPLR